MGIYLHDGGDNPWDKIERIESHMDLAVDSVYNLKQRVNELEQIIREMAEMIAKDKGIATAMLFTLPSYREAKL